MKNNFPLYVHLEIDAYYQRAKSLLLTPSSYEEGSNLENIGLYLHFVEKAIKSKYHRTMHFFLFIEGDNSMAASIYPLCNLKREAIQEIEALYSMSVWISDGMNDYQTSVLDKQS